MAERLVLYLFRQDKEKIKEFSNNLLEFQNVKTCQKCFNIAENDLCQFCGNSKRIQNIICIVEEPLDIIPIEKTGLYNGLYFVLGGNIFQSEGEKNLNIAQLLNRIKSEKFEEVIVATNPTTEGDATTLYLKKKMNGLGTKVTSLARGLSTGGDIEYADEATLTAALTNRKEI